jgi:hypothetical protein
MTLSSIVLGRHRFHQIFWRGSVRNFFVKLNEVRGDYRPLTIYPKRTNPIDVEHVIARSGTFGWLLNFFRPRMMNPDFIKAHGRRVDFENG